MALERTLRQVITSVRTMKIMKEAHEEGGRAPATIHRVLLCSGLTACAATGHQERACHEEGGHAPAAIHRALLCSGLTDSVRCGRSSRARVS